MTEDLLPVRTPVDQPLERYVRANLDRLTELFEAGFSYRALAYLLRRVGFPAANHRTVGTVIERTRRAARAASAAAQSSPPTSTSKPSTMIDDAELLALGSKG